MNNISTSGDLTMVPQTFYATRFETVLASLYPTLHLTYFMPPVFLYSLKVSENQGLSGVFMGYRKRTVV